MLPSVTSGSVSRRENLGTLSPSFSTCVVLSTVGTTGLDSDLNGVNRESVEWRLLSLDEDLELGGDPSRALRRFCNLAYVREEPDVSPELLDVDDSEFGINLEPSDVSC